MGAVHELFFSVSCFTAQGTHTRTPSASSLRSSSAFCTTTASEVNRIIPALQWYNREEAWPVIYWHLKYSCFIKIWYLKHSGDINNQDKIAINTTHNCLEISSSTQIKVHTVQPQVSAYRFHHISLSYLLENKHEIYPNHKEQKQQTEVHWKCHLTGLLLSPGNS